MTSTTFFIIFIPILGILLLAINLILAPHNPLIWIRKSNIRDKLLNSGDPLKLLIPSNIRNNICGWNNYSGMVISQKIYESKIGYRGSKSVIYRPTKDVKNIAVKEQRVDGSWCDNKLPYLRCTLAGFERNYQVKILSNLINYTTFCSQHKAEGVKTFQVRNYSNLPSTLNLNPWYITGFTDGEGCFMLTIIKDKKYKLGWRVACRFIISLNNKDLKLLNDIKYFFGVGNISFMGENAIQYRVESLKDLAIIINHFDKYPLITKKQADYILFKSAYDLIKNKNHITNEGILELVALKAVLNKGLSNDLSVAFPDIVPALRPEVLLPKFLDPFWLVGFTEAEGCFSVTIFKSLTSKRGEAIKLSFILTQSDRDKDLMNSLIKYLGCGYITSVNRGTISFKVTKFSNIRDNIIPLFEKYLLQGSKNKDFLYFSEVVKLVHNKAHLTKQGLNLIRIIKNKMNTNKK